MPLSDQPSPVRVARVVMDAMSEPASGSDRQYAPSCSPESMPGSSDSCCSRLPNVATGYAVRLCTLTPTATLIQTEAISSTTWR